MTAILFQVVFSEKNSDQDIYVVKSITFRPGSEVELGKVFIDKSTKKYDFIPSEIWISSGFSKPSDFYNYEDKDLEDLPEEHRPKGWPWGLLIHKRVLSLIRREYQNENN